MHVRVEMEIGMAKTYVQHDCMYIIHMYACIICNRHHAFTVYHVYANTIESRNYAPLLCMLALGKTREGL